MYLVVKVEKNFQMQDFFSWMKVLDHLKKENPISKYFFIFTIVFIIQNYRT